MEIQPKQPSIINRSQVVKGEDVSTFKQTITMDNGKKFVVTIHYPEGSLIDKMKAEQDLGDQVEKMVRLAVGLGLGSDGLKKIQVTNTRVFGVWNNEPRKDFKEKLKTDLAKAKEMKNEPKIAEIKNKLKIIKNTDDIFKTTYPKPGKKDEPTTSITVQPLASTSKKDTKKTTKPITEPISSPTIKSTIPKVTKFSNKFGVDFNSPVKMTDANGKAPITKSGNKLNAHITWFFLETGSKNLSDTQKENINNRAEKIFNDHVVEYFKDKGKPHGPYELSWDNNVRKKWGNKATAQSMLCGGEAESFKQGLHAKLKKDPLVSPYLSERGAKPGEAAPAHIDLGSVENLENRGTHNFPIKFPI